MDDLEDDVETEDDMLPTPSAPTNISPAERELEEEAEDETDEQDESGGKGGDQENLAEHEDGEEEVGAVDPHDIPLVDRDTGEPIDPALRAEANADLQRRGLDYDIGEYGAAASVLEHLPEDMASSQAFLEAALDAGMTPDQVQAAYQWLADGRAAQRETDLAARDEMLSTLKENWGSRFEENLSELKGFIGNLPDEVGNAIQNARLSDGRLLVNVDGFADAMMSLAKSGARSAPSAKERLATIAATLRDNPQRYFREGMDQEAIKLRRQAESSQPVSSAGAQRIQAELDKISATLRNTPDVYFKRNLGDRAIELRRQLAGIKATNAARGR